MLSGRRYVRVCHALLIVAGVVSCRMHAAAAQDAAAADSAAAMDSSSSSQQQEQQVSVMGERGWECVGSSSVLHQSSYSACFASCGRQQQQHKEHNAPTVPASSRGDG